MNALRKVLTIFGVYSAVFTTFLLNRHTTTPQVQQTPVVATPNLPKVLGNEPAFHAFADVELPRAVVSRIIKQSEVADTLATLTLMPQSLSASMTQRLVEPAEPLVKFVQTADPLPTEPLLSFVQTAEPPLAVEGVEYASVPPGIPLNRLRFGYLAVVAKVRDKSVRFLIDTSAPTSSLDPERTESLGVKWKPIPIAPDDTSPNWGVVFTGELDGVEFPGHWQFTIDVRRYGIARLNKRLRECGEEPVDGILGNDFLEKFVGHIDFRHLLLHLRLYDGPPLANTYYPSPANTYYSNAR